MTSHPAFCDEPAAVDRVKSLVGQGGRSRPLAAVSPVR